MLRMLVALLMAEHVIERLGPLRLIVARNAVAVGQRDLSELGDSLSPRGCAGTESMPATREFPVSVFPAAVASRPS